ncbi:MAG: site-2 protease family protein [Clostridia bacterium]|nr:site-2 protease family protein [Clostridia bacterium]
MFDPNQLVVILLSIPGVFLALSVHECAHGYMSWRLGDPTARNLGRLTLNPIKHIDPIGLICMILFRFGWAKPVPINARYYKKPRRDMVLVAAAGPVSNLLMSLVAVVMLHLVYLLYSLKTGAASFYMLWYGAMTVTPFDMDGVTKFVFLLFIFLQQFAMLNVSLAVFNLIPIPPLDGSKIIYMFLPTKAYFSIVRYENVIRIVFFALLFFGALDGFLGDASIWLLNKIIYLVELLPFFRF